MCFGYTRSALMMVRAQPEPRNSVPCTCCTQSDLDVAAEYHHPLEDSVICDLHPFDLTFPYVAPIKEINQVIQPHWDPFALLSIRSSWQSQANYALSQSIESVPEMPYDSSISREYCREYGSSPSQGSYELQEAILSTQHPMAGSLANKHHNLTPNRPLAGGYVHDQNSYCVMGVLGRGGGRSHGKIRVRRPPGVRWNETMQLPLQSKAEQGSRLGETLVGDNL
ncbi:hypothetical protein B0J17DRAFT_632158 [Rhizoctonia solani]|nr:hypothetical protein B0J17DRAFT_632158 [Rhizoctonia solani]